MDLSIPRQNPFPKTPSVPEPPICIVDKHKKPGHRVTIAESLQQTPIADDIEWHPLLKQPTIKYNTEETSLRRSINAHLISLSNQKDMKVILELLEKHGYRIKCISQCREPFRRDKTIYISHIASLKIELFVAVANISIVQAFNIEIPMLHFKKEILSDIKTAIDMNMPMIRILNTNIESTITDIKQHYKSCFSKTTKDAASTKNPINNFAKFLSFLENWGDSITKYAFPEQFKKYKRYINSLNSVLKYKAKHKNTDTDTKNNSENIAELKQQITLAMLYSLLLSNNWAIPLSLLLATAIIYRYSMHNNIDRERKERFKAKYEAEKEKAQQNKYTPRHTIMKQQVQPKVQSWKAAEKTKQEVPTGGIKTVKRKKGKRKGKGKEKVPTAVESSDGEKSAAPTPKEDETKTDRHVSGKGDEQPQTPPKTQSSTSTMPLKKYQECFPSYETTINDKKKNDFEPKLATIPEETETEEHEITATLPPTPSCPAGLTARASGQAAPVRHSHAFESSALVKRLMEHIQSKIKQLKLQAYIKGNDKFIYLYGSAIYDSSVCCGINIVTNLPQDVVKCIWGAGIFNVHAKTLLSTFDKKHIAIFICQNIPRADFSICALGIDLINGHAESLAAGLPTLQIIEDIERKRLIPISGDWLTTFQQNPLSIIRFIHFMVVHKMKPQPLSTTEYPVIFSAILTTLHTVIDPFKLRHKIHLYSFVKSLNESNVNPYFSLFWQKLIEYNIIFHLLGITILANKTTYHSATSQDKSLSELKEKEFYLIQLASNIIHIFSSLQLVFNAEGGVNQVLTAIYSYMRYIAHHPFINNCLPIQIDFSTKPIPQVSDKLVSTYYGIFEQNPTHLPTISTYDPNKIT